MGLNEKLFRISPLEYMKPGPVKETLSFGRWVVDPNGDMSFDEWYHITADRLRNNDWILHLSEKAWINWNEFIPAYLQALENARIQKVTLLAYYK